MRQPLWLDQDEVPASFGAKAAGLARLTRAGLAVPPGFVVPPGELLDARVLERALARLLDAAREQMRCDTRTERPTLVCVRPSPGESMARGAETALDLGLPPDGLDGLAEFGGADFAADVWRRFARSYAGHVRGLDLGLLEERLSDGAAAWDGLDALLTEAGGDPLPRDPGRQIADALKALSHTAPDAAMVVQAMAFGNLDESSGAGQAATRDPGTGEARPTGEHLPQAQGDDLIGGFRPSLPLTAKDAPSLGERDPAKLEALCEAAERVEAAFGEPQRIEYAFEGDRLWLVQSSPAKLGSAARIRALVDMAEAGVISRQEALLRVEPASLERLLHWSVDPGAERRLLARGLPASTGAASGPIVFSAAAAIDAAAAGNKAILVRPETLPHEVAGMAAAAGVLTTRGGMTSHAAVVARTMGRPCITAAQGVRIDEAAGTLTVKGRTLRSGDVVTVDGAAGELLDGAVTLRPPRLERNLDVLLGWADEAARMEVRANADTPADAQRAREFGAHGVGLCRTEHMFFGEGRADLVRALILAETSEDEEKAARALLAPQRRDFAKILVAMRGLPVTVRLLDPPLHEFLPQEPDEIIQTARHLGLDAETLAEKIAAMEEVNPMLGFRGCRLLLARPLIARMQVRAALEAVAEIEREGGEAALEILIPFVGFEGEVHRLRGIIEETANRVRAETGLALPFALGTMIEVPRAALRARALAAEADFFSFGTNDLTQTTLGLSRDDAAPFLRTYEADGILEASPFSSLDRDGVGALMRIAVEGAREARADYPIGVCGEHGADPASLELCEMLGVSYVSCSPFRVPIARLAAAQAALRRSGESQSVVSPASHTEPNSLEQR